MITVKQFGELNVYELYEILRARCDIFVIEQHCFYPDLDKIDYDAWHVFERDEQTGEVKSYARLFTDNDNKWHIGRVLARNRLAGEGRELMLATLATARELGATAIEIDAQTYCIGFYEKLGFSVISDEFEEAGIMHVKMTTKWNA